MVFYKFKPTPTSRMAIINTISTIRESILLELGHMEDMIYSSIFVCKSSIGKDFKFETKFDQDYNLIFRGTDETIKKLEEILSKNKPKLVFIMAQSQKTQLGPMLTSLVNYLEQYPDIKIIQLGSDYLDKDFHTCLSAVLLKIVEELATNQLKTLDLTYNIIGSCSDMYKYASDLDELSRILENALGLRSNCILSSHSSVEEIENLPAGWVNLVIREEGLAAAQYLEQAYSMPYIYARPYGVQGTISWLETIGELLDLDLDQDYLNWELARIKEELGLDYKNLKDKTLSLAGHSDIITGIKDFALRECGLEEGLSWPNNKPGLTYSSEEDFFTNYRPQGDKHILMASGEVIEASCLTSDYQISNPDSNMKVNVNTRPLVGFSGAIDLVKTWGDHSE